MWRLLDKASQPPTAAVSQLHHSCSDLANHFTSKVNRIHAATQSATSPKLQARSAGDLSTFGLVTTEEAHRLLTRVPSKHCSLDPAPTWLIKKAADVLAPVLAAVCNASLQSGTLPESQKQARVTARLKKPTMNADDLNAYRPQRVPPHLESDISVEVC